MIDYSSFDNMYFVDYDKREKMKNDYIIEQIKGRIKKLETKNETIKNLQYEADLIQNDIISCIRYDLSNSQNNIFWGVVDDIMHRAWLYGKETKEWEDKEQYERCKTAYDYVLSIIKIKFLKGIDNVNFKEICMYGYGGYAYDFRYEINGINIEIYVPNFSQTNSQNYSEMLNGYAVRYEESPHSWDWISGGFDLEKIHQDLVDFITKKES